LQSHGSKHTSTVKVLLICIAYLWYC